jgi:hypothetical protein
VVSVLDDVDDGTRRLLRVLLDVYDSRGGWPVHQWVRRELQDVGLGLDDVLRRLPVWQHNYRSVNVMQTGIGDLLESKIVPTMHGLVHSGHPTAARLVELFLAAVRVAEERQRIVPLDPLEVRTVRISAEDLTTGVAALMSGDVNVDAMQLRLMLRLEPSTWSGIPGHPDDAAWSWDLSRASLWPYIATSGQNYLTALEQHVIGVPAPLAATGPIDPLALPRALDNLDVTWLALTKARLMQRRSSTSLAELALSVNSGEEYQSRLSALADALSLIRVPSTDDTTGPLNRFKNALRERVTDPITEEQAAAAVDRLRDLVALRVGQQHTGAALRGREAAGRLGIQYTGDWDRTWVQVRHIAIQALYEINDSLASELPS